MCPCTDSFLLIHAYTDTHPHAVQTRLPSSSLLRHIIICSSLWTVNTFMYSVGMHSKLLFITYNKMSWFAWMMVDLGNSSCIIYFSNLAYKFLLVVSWSQFHGFIYLFFLLLIFVLISLCLSLSLSNSWLFNKLLCLSLVGNSQPSKWWHNLCLFSFP